MPPHSALKDQRTKSAYIFSAICPEHGKGAGLVLPFSNTETMALHLAEISLAIAPRAHAIVLMDQAGWHTTGKLKVPANITSSRCRPSALNSTRSRTSAVHARQQAVEPHLHILRSHRRSLLRGLEQAHRPAMAHHDHRPTKMGAKVMIHAGWYQFRCGRTDRLPRF